MSVGTVKPKWVDDSLVNECQKCRKTFGFWVRKHHCRRCGKIFCKDCSDHNIIIPKLVKYYGREPQRVCDTCFYHVHHENASSGLGSSSRPPPSQKQPGGQQPGGQPPANAGRGGAQPRGGASGARGGAAGSTAGRGAASAQPVRTKPPEPLRSGRDLFIQQTLSNKKTPTPSAPPAEDARAAHQPNASQGAGKPASASAPPIRRGSSASSTLPPSALDRYKKKDSVMDSIFDDVPPPQAKKPRAPMRSHSATPLVPADTKSPPVREPSPSSPGMRKKSAVVDDIFALPAQVAPSPVTSAAQASAPPDQAQQLHSASAPAVDRTTKPPHSQAQPPKHDRRPSLSLFERPEAGVSHRDKRKDGATSPQGRPSPEQTPSAPPQQHHKPLDAGAPANVGGGSGAAGGWQDPFASDPWANVQRDPAQAVAHRPEPSQEPPRQPEPPREQEYRPREQQPLPSGAEVPPRDGGLQETPHMNMVQNKLFLRWVNYWLSVRNVSIADLETGFRDGTMLIALVEILTNTAVEGFHSQPTTRNHMLENIDIAIYHCARSNLTLPPTSVHAVADGDRATCLDLVWALMYRFEVQSNAFQDAHGIFAVLTWAKLFTEGYSGVNICDFNSSFQNGLVYCAIVHRYNPSLVDYQSLNPMYAEENLRLAFENLWSGWGVPILLDSSDIATQPDDVSTIAYLSMCYKIMNNL